MFTLYFAELSLVDSNVGYPVTMELPVKHTENLAENQLILYVRWIKFSF